MSRGRLLGALHLHSQGIRRLVTALACLALATTAFGAGATPASPAQVPSTTAPQKAPLAYERLDYGANLIVAADNPLATAASRGYRVRDRRVQVEVHVTRGNAPAVARALESGGAEWVSSYDDVVQAQVTPAQLLELAHDDAVTLVRRPLYAHLPEPEPERADPSAAVASSTSEGVSAMNASAWHAAGHTDFGVRIGIIDVGFGGYTSLLGSELPPSSKVHYRAFGSAEFNPHVPHGTACAEIIHDVAPDAELYLALIDSEVDALNAMDWLLSQGVQVVSMSLTFEFSGPGDGTGSLQSAIDSKVNSNGLFVAVPAGGARRAHWQGTTVDSDNDGWVNIDGEQEILPLVFCTNFEPGYVLRGDTIRANVVWNDWSTVSRDYSLVLVRLPTEGDPVYVTSQDDVQSGSPGSQVPVESLSYTVTEGGYYGIAINRSGVSGINDIEVFTDFSSRCLDPTVASGSLGQPGDAAGAVAVAAISHKPPYSYRLYSSRGPTNGPGGSLSGGRTKPDIAGYTDVTTATYGPSNFTSAACPHVAGAAALVWGAHPSWTNTQVRSYLESNALDLGAEGKDDDYGYGRLYLGAPPSASCPYIVSPTSASFAASGGSGSISVSSDSGCSWSASADAPWLHILSGSSSSGAGAVSFSVDANSSSPARSGTMTVANRTVIVTQERSQSCSYSVFPTAVSLGSTGGTGTISVTTTSDCSWEATSNAPWVHVTAGASSFGSGVVSYSVDATTVGSRRGTLTVAGQNVPVNQADSPVCSYTISPRSNDFPGSGGTASIALTTSAGCGWTASSDAGWAKIVPPTTGSGSADIQYEVSPNTAADPRAATLTVAGIAYSIGQAGAGGGARYLVAGVAHAGGSGGSTWRSSLSVTNRSGSPADLTLTYRSSAGTVARSYSLCQSCIAEWDDVAVSLFNVGGPSSGSVEVTSDREVMVTARTYNETASGTYGQYLPGAKDADAVTEDHPGTLPGVKKSGAFRTNIGFVNLGGASCTVRTTLFSQNGSQLGSTVVTTVPAGQWKQENDIFARAGVDYCLVGFATVEVTTAGGSVWAYASVVDNGSGDPTTVPVFVQSR